jgi:hypothetical protein
MLTGHECKFTLPLFAVRLIAKSAVTVIGASPRHRCDIPQNPDKLYRFILCNLPKRLGSVPSVIFPSDFDFLGVCIGDDPNFATDFGARTTKH